MVPNPPPTTPSASPSSPAFGAVRRRPRGAAKGNPTVYGSVAPAAKEILVLTATTLRVSQARVIEDVLLALDLDEDGVPTVLNRARYA